MQLAAMALGILQPGVEASWQCTIRARRLVRLPCVAAVEPKFAVQWFGCPGESPKPVAMMYCCSCHDQKGDDANRLGDRARLWSMAVLQWYLLRLMTPFAICLSQSSSYMNV